MQNNKKFKTLDLVFIAVFAALMAICAWITVPGAVPFTLQTFGVFIAVGLLGGKRGTLSVLLYILLGLVGLPVFSGFKGGIGTLLGTTGGYIIGFIFSALVMWLMGNVKLKNKIASTVYRVFTMVVGLLVCYAFGTAWFMVVYTKANGAVSLATCLGWCVIPFIIPDLVKIGLAFVLSDRLKRFIPE